MSKQWSVSLRPTKLSEVYGCENIKKFFDKKGKAGPDAEFPNSILLSGVYGSGKTTVAKIIAARMTCTRPQEDGEACGECENCKSIINETYNRGGVKFIDGSQASKDDVITELSDYVQGAPFNSPRKVVLIDEAQELSTSASKSLLKLLETPKKNLHFILTSMGNSDGATKSGSGKEVPRSIISRCQQFVFKKAQIVEIMMYLKKTLEDQKLWDVVPKDFKLQGLQMIADASNGSLRQALQLLEQAVVLEAYTPELLQENLGIEDTLVFNEALLAILDGKTDEVTYNTLMNGDYLSIFNVSYKVVSDAHCVSIFGKIPGDSQFYKPQAEVLAKHKNFKILVEGFQKLSEKSNPYLKKADYITCICEMIEKCKTGTTVLRSNTLAQQTAVRRVAQ